MATPTRIRQGTRIVKPILSLDRTEARRRVHNLYKLCYRHIPYISKHMHFWAGVKCGMQKMAVVLITSSDPNGPQRTSSGPNNEARYLTIVMVLCNIANKVKSIRVTVDVWRSMTEVQHQRARDACFSLYKAARRLSPRTVTLRSCTSRVL